MKLFKTVRTIETKLKQNLNKTVSKLFQNSFVWFGGVPVRALDLRLEIAGSIPAAALSSATLDKLFTHTVQRSEVTTLWRYINQFKF